jgi:threonine/homoserine/homoserine lactone efflux protein
MNAGSLFATVAAAHALAVVSPGPDLAMVTRQTLAHGRTAGLRTALGIGCGIAFHVAYAFFGLAWAIRQYPALLTVLRIAGAGVLFWMGITALRASRPAAGVAATEPLRRPARIDFGIGVLTNALNIKAVLFFVGLGSVVIAAAAPVQLRLALGAWMVVATAGWFCFVAWTLGHNRVRARLAASSHWIDRAMGAILLVLGIAVLLVGSGLLH